MNVDLRKVAERDIEKIRKWRNSDLIQNVSYNREQISAEQQKNWFDRIKVSSNQLHWIITANGTDAGYAAIKDIDVENSRCEFASLYIGETNLLLSGAGAFAEYKVINYVYSNFPYINKIYCEVLGFNKKVIQLHKRFGFEIEGELKQHYYINEQYENVTVLALFRHNWDKSKTMIEKILNK
jgi:hypothetical protein